MIRIPRKDWSELYSGIEERNHERILEIKARMPELYETLLSIEPPVPGDFNPDLYDPDTEEEDD